jgi:hypothetical protein
MELAQVLALLQPGNIAVYLMSLFLGLLVQYQAAKSNKRTNATTFWEYWTVETPGVSQATVVALITAAGTVIQSGMLEPMAPWAVVMFGFTKAYTFDAIIASPVAPKAVA